MNTFFRVAVFYSVWFCGAALAGDTLGPEKGVLYISGGGQLNFNEFVQLVRKTTGEREPRICVVTTAQGNRRTKAYNEGVPFRLVNTLKTRFKLEKTTELFTLRKEDANTEPYYGLIDEADAVFMSGGNQSFLTDAFLGTKVHDAMLRLLERGGVIGGSSAGAQAQSSFMTRGDYTQRSILGDKKHQVGFGFVKNAAFDVHVSERSREKDLLKLFRAKPKQLQEKGLNPLGLLGVGIDQGTTIIVEGNRFRVSGSNKVYVFDPQEWGEGVKPFYTELVKGQVFDMKERRVLNPRD